VRVRIGIHTGEPAVEEGDYLGLDVRRTVRIGNAGHGGQILLSEATARLIGDGEGDRFALKDLGHHHLAGSSLDLKESFSLSSPTFRPIFPT
jgi:class 3 adenylate cyclase